MKPITGADLRRYRKQRGLSIAELAEKLGVGIHAVTDYEKAGRRQFAYSKMLGLGLPHIDDVDPMTPAEFANWVENSQFNHVQLAAHLGLTRQALYYCKKHLRKGKMMAAALRGLDELETRI